MLGVLPHLSLTTAVLMTWGTEHPRTQTVVHETWVVNHGLKSLELQHHIQFLLLPVTPAVLNSVYRRAVSSRTPKSAKWFVYFQQKLFSQETLHSKEMHRITDATGTRHYVSTSPSSGPKEVGQGRYKCVFVLLYITSDNGSGLALY